ncbi:MAG: MotA/TolQ/ExbB proton channel family protein [Erythrobacter sp.]
MPPGMSSLFDPGSLGIVMAGTILATLARCGWRDCSAALSAASGLARGGFQAAANRKALALAIAVIRNEGQHRAEPALPPDRAFPLMLEAFLREGTLVSARKLNRTERTSQEERRVNAMQVFQCAGELAPVFGLIGTLYGLTQLAPGDGGSHATAVVMAAVSTAVLTSLYGALMAHLVCFPLASAIERQGLAEEQAREALADWFALQIGGSEAAAQHPRSHLWGVA